MFVPSLSFPTRSFLPFYVEAVSLICSNFIVIVTVFVLVWEDFKGVFHLYFDVFLSDLFYNF